MAIQIKKANKGKFTKYAKSKRKSVQQAASTILANKDKYSSTLVKRANFAKNASKWKHEDGGLVEYPFGGVVSGLGGVLGAIPTPFTKIAGAAVSVIGGLVGAKEQQKEQERQEREAFQTQAQNEARSANYSLRNPYPPTMAIGGEIGGPTKKGHAANTTVDFGWPMTDANVMYGSGIDPKVWGGLSPVQRADTINKLGKYRAYISNETANPGRVQYFEPRNAKVTDVVSPKVPITPAPGLMSGEGSAYDIVDGKLVFKGNVGKFTTGGLIKLGTPTAEIEGGEVTQGPDGSMALFQGPSHKQGGIVGNFQKGTRVFSDKLINPATGNTFAFDANVLRKQLK